MLGWMGFPVSAWSTGARVGEVLPVGDEGFQSRSKDRIDSLLETRLSVVLVSHNLDQVVALADRVLWIDHGRPAIDQRPIGGRGGLSGVEW